jgi:hypothetical protein
MTKPTKSTKSKTVQGWEKIRSIQQQIEREKTRHRNRLAVLAARRTAAAGLPTPQRAYALAGLPAETSEEMSRYNDKISSLTQRLREVWQ